MDEPCTVGVRSYHLAQRTGRTVITGNRAEVEVEFSYPEACGQGGVPEVHKVNLRKVSGKWLINDWTYEDGRTLVGEMRSHKY